MEKFGSNTMPRHFGKGAFQRPDWTCVCGTENRKWHTKCQMCGITYELATEATQN